MYIRLFGDIHEKVRNMIDRRGSRYLFMFIFLSNDFSDLIANGIMRWNYCFRDLDFHSKRRSVGFVLECIVVKAIGSQWVNWMDLFILLTILFLIFSNRFWSIFVPTINRSMVVPSFPFAYSPDNQICSMCFGVFVSSSIMWLMPKCWRRMLWTDG